jgi:uncharacterized protein YwgA
MSAIVDYGLDSPARALLLLVLSIKDREKKMPMNKLRFQKTILYFERLQQEKEVDFSNFLYGGVSYELQENLDTLMECGLVDKIGGKFELTHEGEKVAGQLAEKYDKETLRKLIFAKEQLNDLPDKELLFLMYMLFPETQANSIEFHNLCTEKEAIIRKLFVKGRTSSHMAAKWLGTSEKEFLESLSKTE